MTNVKNIILKFFIIYPTINTKIIFCLQNDTISQYLFIFKDFILHTNKFWEHRNCAWIL